MMYALFKRQPGEWRQFFMTMAQQVALLSKDPDRKVGAVLVTANRRQLSFGYNGFPADIPDVPANLADKAFKLAHIIHAEDNCLHQAPFFAKGCTLYVTRFPCKHCAEKIVMHGIAHVVSVKPDLHHEQWGSSWAEAIALFKEQGIKVTYMAEKPHGT